METKNFISIDKKHSFKITILEDTAYFELLTIDPSKYKTFLLLLKNAYEYLKTHNVQYVKQQINADDRDSFKRSVILEEDDILIVKTNIDDFLFELCDALGMYRL